MLQQLTTYLLKFHQVHRPGVGTLRLAQLPATLDVANKQVLPPAFEVQYSGEGRLTAHQIWYFSKAHAQANATQAEIENFCLGVRRQIEQAPFQWRGIGEFRYKAPNIEFRASEHPNPLQPVPAERVLREAATHEVLVGNRTVFSNSQTAAPPVSKPTRNWSHAGGWALAVLAFFFILFYLYQHGFATAATGLHETISVARPTATYRQ